MPDAAAELLFQVIAGRAEQAAAADVALEVVLATSNNPSRKWVFDPRLEGESEVPWTGLLGGEIEKVQVDLIFLGGNEPRGQGVSVWWIALAVLTAERNSLTSNLELDVTERTRCRKNCAQSAKALVCTLLSAKMARASRNRASVA
jgi:hypothetical protein